ncbi:MAG: hypothetical protein ISS45_13150 [Candidatus Omnitrophica bacterium]|nr:hypothetical protein [Candidatus Omnitrophota bacterium]
MRRLIYSMILIFAFCGCATRSGQFSNGREYVEYDIIFDKEEGNFHVPLEWVGR